MKEGNRCGRRREQSGKQAPRHGARAPGKCRVECLTIARHGVATVAVVAVVAAVAAVVLALAVSFVVTGLVTGTPTYFGVRPFVVVSESMEPTLHVGQVVWAVPVKAEGLQVGDIVVYSSPLFGKDSGKHASDGWENGKITKFRGTGEKNTTTNSQNAPRCGWVLCKNTIHRIKVLNPNGTAVLRGDNNSKDDDTLVSTDIRYKAVLYETPKIVSFLDKQKDGG